MKIQLNVPFFSQRENNVIWEDMEDQGVKGFPRGGIQFEVVISPVLPWYYIITQL